jgi:acyl-CoA reductase-like NAD-dependent aldehyde dehydrogenase
MDYINSGKKEGATVHLGGERHGTEGYWIQPTIFTDTRPDMRIVQEEIFGPVGVIIKFKNEEDVLRQANDTLYGLAAAVFTRTSQRRPSLRISWRPARCGSTASTRSIRTCRSEGTSSRVWDASSASTR